MSVTNFFFPCSSNSIVVYCGSTSVMTPRPYFWWFTLDVTGIDFIGLFLNRRTVTQYSIRFGGQ